MLLRSLRDSVSAIPEARHAARVDLPVRIGPAMVETAFVSPLDRFLEANAFGRVQEHALEFARTGEPMALRLDLSLTEAGCAAKTRIAAALEELEAPAGSTIGDPDSADAVQFGRSEGLGLYLPATGTTEDDCLEIAETCADALGGAGVYQGSIRFGDRIALYFYGDSFNRMRAEITYLLTYDPEFRSAVVRRLNAD